MQEVYPRMMCSPGSQPLTSALVLTSGSLGKYSNKFKDDQIVVRTTALDPTCHRRGEIQTKATLRCGGGARTFLRRTGLPSSFSRQRVQVPHIQLVQKHVARSPASTEEVCACW